MRGKCDNKERDYIENIHCLGFWDIKKGVTLRSDIAKVRCNLKVFDPDLEVSLAKTTISNFLQ